MCITIVPKICEVTKKSTTILFEVPQNGTLNLV